MTKTSHHAHRTTPQVRRRSWGPYLLIGSGFLLLASLALWYWGGSPGSVARAAHNPADVVHDQPLHGVHEMGPPAEQPPFLPQDSPQPRIEIPESFHGLGGVILENNDRTDAHEAGTIGEAEYQEPRARLRDRTVALMMAQERREDLTNTAFGANI